MFVISDMAREKFRSDLPMSIHFDQLYRLPAPNPFWLKWR
jgi:hypothetical protein